MTVDQITISRFSTITHLSQKALRYYDEKGLLVPGAKDPFTGYRYYTGDQLERGVKIKTLSLLGFGVEEITELLRSEEAGDDASVRELLRQQLEATRSEVQRLHRVEALLSKGFQGLMNVSLQEPVVKEVPSLRVLSSREKGTYGTTVGKLVGRLMKVATHPDNQRNSVKIAGPFMAIYHDEGYKETDADIEVAVPVSGKVEIEDPEVELRNLPATKVLSIVHKGSYETLPLSYRAINEYALKKGIELKGPDRELYLNDPAKTTLENLMTEIQIPLK
jgi:effector-binding domain-containing protein